MLAKFGSNNNHAKSIAFSPILFAAFLAQNAGFTSHLPQPVQLWSYRMIMILLDWLVEESERPLVDFAPYRISWDKIQV